MNAFMKIGNFFTKFLLRSPFHGMMSSNTLLISFTGWKSGKAYTTPTNYNQEGDIVRIVSQRDRVWWRNLVGGAPVTLRIRGDDKYGTADAFTDNIRVAQGLEAFLQPNPQFAGYFSIGLDEHGNFKTDDIKKAAKTRVIVEISLAE
jgi:hypothetical protein